MNCFLSQGCCFIPRRGSFNVFCQTTLGGSIGLYNSCISINMVSLYSPQEWLSNGQLHEFLRSQLLIISTMVCRVQSQKAELDNDHKTSPTPGVYKKRQRSKYFSITPQYSPPKFELKTRHFRDLHQGNQYEGVSSYSTIRSSVCRTQRLPERREYVIEQKLELVERWTFDQWIATTPLIIFPKLQSSSPCIGKVMM